jgi:hypothetical protein
MIRSLSTVMTDKQYHTFTIYRYHVSLAEIVGHAQDHCVLKEGNLLHWLFQEGIS